MRWVSCISNNFDRQRLVVQSFDDWYLFNVLLQKIVISISSLEYIDPKAFDGLTWLKKLHIHSHSLQKPPDLSSAGRTLDTFRLSNFGGAYENINLKSMVNMEALFMEKADQGAVSIRKTVLPGMAIPMLKIRRPSGRLIFNMEIAIRR